MNNTKYFKHIYGQAMLMTLSLLSMACFLVLSLPAVVQSSSNATQMEMSLSEAVFLAIRNSRNIKSLYLDRVLSKFNFEKSMLKYTPSVNLDGTAKVETSGTFTDQEQEQSSRQENYGAGLQADITQEIPTGGEFVFKSSLDKARDWSSAEEDSEDTGVSWSASFTQPLLKGAGLKVNEVDIIKAKLTEQENLLSLRDSLISTITSVITAYRSYLQSYQDVDIQKASLQSARDQLKVNKLLIEAGRKPAGEILQAEANVARQELQYEEFLNSLDQARLSLIEILDIDENTQIIPVEQVKFKEKKFDYEQCLQLALKNSQSYILAQHNVQRSEMNLLLAENDRLWELDFSASYQQDFTNLTPAKKYDYKKDEWKIGANLSAPLFKYGTSRYDWEAALLSAKIDLRKSKLSLKDAEDSLKTSVLNSVRNVRSARKRVYLALRTQKLSLQNYELDQLKFKVGRLSNRDLISSQTTLTSDKQSAVSSIISYLNAIASLEQLLGISLQTWEIKFEPFRPSLEKEFRPNF